MNPAPDLRVFRSITGDHATYDGCLLRVCQDYTNWNRSTFGGNIPLTLDHFREDTRLRLKEKIPTLPGMETQDLSDRRLILPHLAHIITDSAGRNIHAREQGLTEVIRNIRNELDLITKERGLVLTQKDHPLHGHFKARPKDIRHVEGGGKFDFIQGNEKDVALAQALIGDSAGDTIGFINGLNPFLLDIDKTHYRSAVPALRKKLEAYIRGRVILDVNQRKEVIRMIVEDWKDNVLPNELDTLDELEREISAERKVEHILDLPPMEMIDHCFTPLLEEEMTPEIERKLLQRRPIYTHLIMHFSEEIDERVMYKLEGAMRAYTKKMNLTFIDLPHAYLALGAFSMDEETLLNMLS